MQAALKGAEQIGFTILSLTVSLIAVLIPLLFMGGMVGRLFREFAVTLAVTIVISAVVSLTLTPMMCCAHPETRRRGPAEPLPCGLRPCLHATDRVLRPHLQLVLRFQTLTLLVALATLVLTVYLYIIIPKGFFPAQDIGVIQGISQASETISFPAMAERQRDLVQVILRDPAVESLSSFIGADGTNTTLNSGRISINLKPLEVAPDYCLRRNPKTAEERAAGARNPALHAARSEHHRRRSREPHPIPIHLGRPGCRRT